MKNNQMGFSLIELLGVVALLGILSTVAISATTKYLKQSREQSFSMISQSIYEAAQNCQTAGKCSVTTYTTSKLQELGYIGRLKNPRSSKSDCTGSVQINSKHTSSFSGYTEYSYKVTLKCPGMYGGNPVTNTWPDDKTK